MASPEFCTCNNPSCGFNPANHDQGCDLCIEHSLKGRDIPRCYFQKAAGSLDGIDDWSFEHFAKLVLEQHS